MQASLRTRAAGCLVAIAALANNLLRAQASTGMIEGRVFNAATGATLRNARVVLDHDLVATVTDDYGNYRPRAIPPRRRPRILLVQGRFGLDRGLPEEHHELLRLHHHACHARTPRPLRSRPRYRLPQLRPLHAHQRRQRADHRRRVRLHPGPALSPDGGATWTAPADAQPLIEPVCQASIVRHESGLLLFSNPAAKTRVNLTDRASADEAKTWRPIAVLHESPSAYSNLISLSATEAGCLYERGEKRFYEKITFARFRFVP